ncbi:MAG: glycosyltransferase family 4 protein [Acidobacteriota bacterium]|nr:glycosyltransferase family 4 protein [Acidobacteriota bacterium]
MRVGLICPYSLTVPGGVQGQVLGLARSLRHAGVEARVLGPCDGPPPEPWVTPLGNSLPTGDNGSVAAIAPDPAASLRTLRALRDEAFDVVHIHEPLAPGPSITAMVTAACPTIGTFHRSGRSRWLEATKPLARWTVAHLTLMVAVSEEARATAAEILPGRFVVLWNGIELARYRDAEPWPTQGPTIFFVGRHESRKGLAVLLEALDRLGPDVRLWVAGQGPDTERLRRQSAADRRVEWLGFIDDAEKVRRLRGADVLCAPSLHGESFGVVLLEGLAAATPVVATDLAGYRNVARPGIEARLVAPGDAAALAGALTAALERSPETEALVARGQQRAAEYSMDSLAGRYIELYQQVVRARPALASTRMGRARYQ